MSTERVKKMQAILAERDIDAFVSLDPPNNQYLAGFTGTTSAVIVSRGDAYFLCDFRYTEQAAEEVQGFTIEELSGNFVGRVGEKLNALSIKSAAFDPGTMTVAERDRLAKHFPGELVAAEDMAGRLRITKDADEVERLRAASALAEGVLADLVDDLGTGVSEREVAARFVYEFQRRGASGPSFPPIVLFGARSSLPHGQPSERQLQDGDIVLMDFGCRLDGYCSDLTRTYAFGSIPGAWFEEIYNLTLTAQQCALEAVRPGIRGRDLDAAARDLIEEAGHGSHFGHGLGHGVGIEIHEAPRANKESDTVLEPGMVITIEPGVYLPGKGGVRIEDLVVVTDDGCRVLSSTPKELKVLGK